MFTVAMGSFEGEMDIATLIEYVFVAVSAGVDASDTSTVKLYLPALLGLPEISPEGDNDIRAGRRPADSFHVYGCSPPAAVNVAAYAL